MTATWRDRLLPASVYGIVFAAAAFVAAPIIW